jgi:hypothetical protein
MQTGRLDGPDTGAKPNRAGVPGRPHGIRNNVASSYIVWLSGLSNLYTSMHYRCLS